MDIVSIILETIVSAFTTVVTGIGAAVNDMFSSVFLVETAEGVTQLSPIAAWGVAFFAIGLVLSILFRFIGKAT